MKKLFLYLMLATALFAVPACQKDNTDQTPADNTPTGPTDNYEATITLNTQSVNIGPDEGSTEMLIFACDHEWFLEIPEEAQSWLSADKMSGKSGKTIRVTLTGKANNGPARSATCRILSGSKKKKFTVSQNAAVLILTAADVPNLEKYYKPKEFDFDMFLETIGINTNPTPDKSQYVSEIEVGSNNSLIDLERDVRFLNRKKFCEDAKRIGITMSVEVNIDEMKQQADQFMKEVNNVGQEQTTSDRR